MANRNPKRPPTFIKNQHRPLTDWIGHINEIVVCPYNPGHVMKAHKLMRHLMKCEKDNAKAEGHSVPAAVLEVCPYNSLHRYPAGSQEDHFRECKDRAIEFLARRDGGLGGWI